MKELLRLIAIREKIEINVSRFVTIKLSYLENGGVEFLVDNHGPVKPGIQKLVIDDTLENKQNVMQGIFDIEQIKNYVQSQKTGIDSYTKNSQTAMTNMLENLQWNFNLPYDEEYYLTKLLEIAQGGAQIKIDNDKLLRMACFEDEAQFQIFKVEKINDKQLSVELEEDDQTKVAEILINAHAKNKEKIDNKIDEYVHKYNSQLEEITNRINTLYEKFDVEKNDENEQIL